MRVVLIFFTLFFTQTALSQEKWHYTSFPVVAEKGGERKNEKPSLKVGQIKLEALLAPDAATHAEWGVEQVYVSRDLKKKVFVKYDVTFTRESMVEGAWIRLGKGSVLHLKNGNTKSAFFAVGFNSVELHQLKNELNGKGKSAARVWQELLYATAYGETLSGTASRPIPTGSSSSLPAADRSWLARTGSISKCVGKETWAAVKSNSTALYENATWENVKSGARKTATAAWAAVPSREQVRNGAGRSWNFVKGTWNEPGQAWQDINDRFDRSMEAIALISSEIAKSVEGFADLSPALQDQIICNGLEHFAASGTMSLLLAATGAGTTVALAKLSATAVVYASRIRPMMPLIRHLNGMAKLDDDEKVKVIHKLLRGTLSDERRKALETGAAFTHPIARSPKVRIYDGRGELKNHSIEPGNSYTVVMDGGEMILGHEVRGRYTPKPGGAGSHLTLLDLHRKSETPSGTVYNGGAIRFNDDGSIDISGYRRAEASVESEEAIVQAIKELYPTARIRSTPDRIRKLDENSY